MINYNNSYNMIKKEYLKDKELVETAFYMAWKIAEKIQQTTKSGQMIRVFTEEFNTLLELSELVLQKGDTIDIMECLINISLSINTNDYDNNLTLSMFDDIIGEALSDASGAGYDIEKFVNDD